MRRNTYKEDEVLEEPFDRIPRIDSLREDEILFEVRIATDRARTSDQYGVEIKSMLEANGVLREDIQLGGGDFRKILDGPDRQTMLDGYAEVKRRLGDKKAPDEAARMIYQLLNKQPSV